MRFDSGKAWPHPVLRPRSVGDDYPDAEFEVEVQILGARGSTAIDVDATFELSDENLLQIIEDNCAKYVLLVKSPKTHFRRLLTAKDPHIRKSFRAGDLSGRVEFTPFLISTQVLPEFRANGWHSDFAGRTFQIPCGAVLAEDELQEYWIDTANEAPLGSIFGSRLQPRLQDGCWNFELAEDRIWILMSKNDTERFKKARHRVNNQPEAHYLMNGLYLPALTAVLYQVDQDVEEYRESHSWFGSLDERLAAVDCKPLGTPAINRLLDAQKVLEFPFPKMPILVESQEGEM